MASSMKLEFPLNDALPNTDHSRDRLLAKIFRFRKTEDVANDAKDEDYALLYAYGKEDCSNQCESLPTDPAMRNSIDNRTTLKGNQRSRQRN